VGGRDTVPGEPLLDAAARPQPASHTAAARAAAPRAVGRAAAGQAGRGNHTALYHRWGVLVVVFSISSAHVRRPTATKPFLHYGGRGAKLRFPSTMTSLDEKHVMAICFDSSLLHTGP
ncbi:unnamed protein product, partial [Ectocarpus sp. 12 AP-2014]